MKFSGWQREWLLFNARNLSSQKFSKGWANFFPNEIVILRKGESVWTSTLTAGVINRPNLLTAPKHYFSISVN